MPLVPGPPLSGGQGIPALTGDAQGGFSALLIGQGAQALFASYGLPQIHWGIWALAAFAVVTALGHFNIDLSRNVLGVLLIAEVAIVLALDAAVVFTGGHEGLSTGFLHPAQIVSGAPGIALLFAILSFIGFEATAVFRDEARNPLRTIPRATYLSVILIGVFYTVSTWALITAWGESQVVDKAVADPSGLLPGATEQYLGLVGLHIIQVLFVTSLSLASCRSTTSLRAICSRCRTAGCSPVASARRTRITDPRTWPPVRTRFWWRCSSSPRH